MGGHSWTAYFVKGVYTAQPRLVCNSYVAVVVPQVPLVKLFTLQCGNKYTHPTRLIDYACYYYYYLVFRFRSRNALTPVEAIDLPAWVSMSLSYTMLSAKALKGKCRMPRTH